MTPGQLQSAAPYLAAGLLVLALVIFLISLRFFRKSRTDFYWRRRRTAGQRGWRLFVWSLGLMLSSGIICLITGVAGMLNPRPTPPITRTSVALALSPSATVATAPATMTLIATSAATVTPVVYPTTQQPTEQATKESTPATLQATASPTELAITQAVTMSATPNATGAATQTATQAVTVEPSSSPTEVTTTETPLTDTPTFTQTLTDTPTLTPKPTDTPQPSPTSSPTPTETLVRAPLTNTVLDSSVTPGPNAKLNITALDTRISADFRPIAPANTFAAGFNRIYFFISFSGMQSGVLWRRQLVKDGSVIEESAYLWGMAQDGDAYFFFGQESGFQPGSYEIRLFIGQTDQPATAASFTVK